MKQKVSTIAVSMIAIVLFCICGYGEDIATANKNVIIGSYGGEKLGWRVIDTDGKNSLLISQDIIDYKAFSESTVAEETDWENSTLRQWLNEDFYNNTFSDEERNAIQLSTVQDYKADHEAGNQVQDYLFILSVDQAYSYFQTDADRIAHATDYAKQQKEYSEDSWWLIDSYSSDLYKYLISPSGNISNMPRVNEPEGIRPVMWVSSDILEQESNGTRKNINYVSADVNVRSEPNMDSEIVAELEPWSAIEVVSIQDGWAKINYQGQPAYVSSEYVKLYKVNATEGDKQASAETEKGTRYVSSDVNVRTEPSTDAEVLAGLEAGSAIEVISIQDGWAEIIYNGETAYISADYIEKNDQNEIQESPLNGSETVEKAQGETEEKTKPYTKVVMDVMYVSSDVNVRAEPSTDAEILTQLEAWSAVDVVTISDGWAKINYEGQSAYVSSVYIEEYNAKTKMVYVSDKGTKFHAYPECSNMGDPYAISLYDAINAGYDACLKCY